MTKITGLFSDSTIPSDSLMNRISLVVEEDVPKRVILSLGKMLCGDNSPAFEKMAALVDADTEKYYGFIFLAIETNVRDNSSKLIIRAAMLDERLKQLQMISNLIQSLINDYCFTYSDCAHHFIQWTDSNTIECFASRETTKEAMQLARDMIS